MTEKNNELLDSTQPEENEAEENEMATETKEEIEESQDSNIDEETPEELKLRIQKLEEEKREKDEELSNLESKNKQLFERAKKAKKQETGDEAIFIVNGITEDEDMEFIREKARGFGITNREALKDDVIMEHVKRRQEDRKSREATPTGQNTAITRKNSDQLVSQLERGEVTEDQAELRKGIRTRLERKFTGR